MAKRNDEGSINFAHVGTAVSGDLGGDGDPRFIRPKKNWFSRHRNLITAISAVLIIGFVLGGSASGWLNRSSINTMRAEQEQNSNPAYLVRYASLGRDIIRAYYNGGSMPVPVSPEVTLPKTGTSSDEITEDGTNLVQVKDVTFASGKKYRNDYGEDWSRDNKDSFPNPYREELVYKAEMNGTPVQITIHLFVPQKYANNEDGMPTLETNPTVAPSKDYSDVVVDANGNPAGAGMTPVDLSKNKDAKDMLTRFAEAWASGNSEELRSIVNDGTDRRYTSPGGFQLDGEVTINWRYKRSFDDDPGNYIVSRITFPVSQVKTATKTEDGKRSETEVKFGFVQTMDVLMKVGNNSIPNVVSWGSMWKDLTPYSVGVTGEDAKSVESSEESSSSSSTSATPGDSSTSSESSESSTPSSGSTPSTTSSSTP